mgnify:FL=1
MGISFDSKNVIGDEGYGYFMDRYRFLAIEEREIGVLESEVLSVLGWGFVLIRIHDIISHCD